MGGSLGKKIVNQSFVGGIKYEKLSSSAKAREKATETAHTVFLLVEPFSSIVLIESDNHYHDIGAADSSIPNNHPPLSKL